MKIEVDFLKPEFLNILFFKQKNLIIFPHIDVKKLRTLDMFCIDCSCIEIDATLLDDINDLIEEDFINPYNQNKNLYYIFNIQASRIHELIKNDSIRCIINVSNNIEDIPKNEKFVFYNRKINQFYNYSPNNNDLTFETELLINFKENKRIIDDLFQIKQVASKFYAEYCDEIDLEKLKFVLNDFDPIFWPKIIEYIENYYGIEVPKEILPENIKTNLIPIKIRENSYRQEYRNAIKIHFAISKNFIDALSAYINELKKASDLELNYFYIPEDLYVFLRENYWRDKIPDDFIDMLYIKSIPLFESKEELDLFFKKFSSKLPVDQECISSFSRNEIEFMEYKLNKGKDNQREKSSENNGIGKNEKIPDISNFSEFKNWILKILSEIKKQMELK